jgi:hypothetical protein
VIRNGAEVWKFVTHVTTSTATVPQIIHVIPLTVVKVVLGVIVIEFFVHVVVLFLRLRTVLGSFLLGLGLVGGQRRSAERV